MVLDKFFLCWHTEVGNTFLLYSNNSTGQKLEVFLLICSRWWYSTSFGLLLLGCCWVYLRVCIFRVPWPLCGPVPSLSFPVSLGSLVPCFRKCHSCCCLGHWDGGLFPHIWDPELQAPQLWGKRQEEAGGGRRRQGPADASMVSSVITFLWVPLWCPVL